MIKYLILLKKVFENTICDWLLLSFAADLIPFQIKVQEVLLIWNFSQANHIEPACNL